MTHVRNIVLGAGPAGLQMAYFLAQKGEPYVVLERNDNAGSFFERHPRHRTLLSINKRYTGCKDLESRRRYDWNSLLCPEEELQFVEYTNEYFPDSAHLVRYLGDFAKYHGLEIRYGATVRQVSRAEVGFLLATEDGEELSCDRLFVGTGFTQENLPEIDGLELCDTYDGVSVDANDFLDRRVMIVGKGNSAFETADHLVGTTRKMWVCGPRTVRLAWASHYVGDLRAVNNNYLDTYQLKAQNNILDGELRSVRRDAKNRDLVATVYFESRQRSYDYHCDHVVLCTGFRFDPGIFAEGCEPEMRQCGRLPLMTCEWESTNLPEMFFIGTLMQARDYRRTMSAFIHGFRHNIEALDRILDCRTGAPWRARGVFPQCAGELAKLLIQRLSTSAGLLLQPGFLCDAVVLDDEGASVEYLRDLPVDYAHEKLLPKHRCVYLAALEYKKQDLSMDPFAMPRGVGVAEDYYIHPILRRYEEGRLTGRFYLPDDLDNDWRDDPEHHAALEACFARELGGPDVAATSDSGFTDVPSTSAAE